MDNSEFVKYLDTDRFRIRILSIIASDEAKSTVLNSEILRSRIRSVINEDEYWKELAKHFQIENHIRNQIEQEFQATKKKLDKLKKEAKEEIRNDLPAQVSYQVGLFMPNYLDQNSTMQTLLQDHIHRIRETLDQAVTDILKTIIEDPQYHEINRIYFEQFYNNGQKVLQQFNIKGENAIADVRVASLNTQNELTHRVDEKIQTITRLEENIKTLKQTIKSQSNLQLYNTIGLCCTLALISYTWFTKK